MPTLNIPLPMLRELLTKVIPFAARDTWMPTLNAVKIEARDGSLISSATDRYVIGMARIEYAADDFAVIIPLDRCRDILSYYKQPRRAIEVPNVVLELDDDKRLTISQPGSDPEIRLAFDAEKGNPPDLTRMTRDLFAKETTDQPVTIAAEYLAKFKHLGDLAIKPTGERKPVLILASGFVGAVMSKGMSDKTTAEILTTKAAEWASVLGVGAEAEAAA